VEVGRVSMLELDIEGLMAMLELDIEGLITMLEGLVGELLVV
jgi:hypothetical protein